ncbi:hypothetical protein Salat_0832400 [Sesamum alatum]|uniref:Secreted protein n=1 Tax=Sesamum alatum TaxID=300844 RepID=A0AAE1YIH1_9LAMI|nr:hypothetical protein Salat_0832400 [Sesamum alatum]
MKLCCKTLLSHLPLRLLGFFSAIEPPLMSAPGDASYFRVPPCSRSNPSDFSTPALVIDVLNPPIGHHIATNVRNRLSCVFKRWRLPALSARFSTGRISWRFRSV